MAYIDCRVSLLDGNKLLLQFDGLHEKIKDFISKIWDKIKSFKPIQQHFKVCFCILFLNHSVLLTNLTLHITGDQRETSLGVASQRHIGTCQAAIHGVISRREVQASGT